MKIFIITTVPIMKPYDDASKNLAIELIKKIDKYEFIIIGSGKNFLNKSNIKWINSPFSRKGIHHMPLSQKVFIFFNILFYMSQTDLFHFIITPEKYSSFILKIMFKLFKKKSIQTINSIHTLEIKRKYKSIDKLLFADKIICFSNYSKNKLESKNIKNVEVLYPIISLSRFNPKKIKPIKKIKKDAKYIVVYPGNYNLLDLCYGLDNFCKIIKGVVNKLNSVRFIMLCRTKSNEDKKLKRKFKKLAINHNILNNIKFMDTVEDIPSVFRTCDLGIYPTKNVMTNVLEIPLVLLELMAMKKPIIFGDVPPLDEIMKSKIGIKLSEHSAENYSKTIISLIKNTKLRKEMGNNGRRTVIKYFNPKSSIKNYKKIYEEVGMK